MVYIFITIAISLTFIVEAKKRNQSPVKWTLIGLGAFWSPMIVISIVVIPIVIIATKTPIDESQNIQIIFGLAGFALGFILVIKARKRLLAVQLVENDPNEIVVTSQEIIENDDGTFSADDRSFTSRADAEEYISLLKRTES